MMKNLLVKDWMSKNVITASPDTTLPEAAALMRENKIRRLPVVRESKLVGIVSNTDVIEARPSDATTLDIWELNYLLSRLRVEKIMSADPYTVQSDDSIRDAAQLMYEHKVGGIPVVDESNNVVGIITESDIFRIIIEWLNGEKTE